MTDSFGARQPLTVGDSQYHIHRLDAVGDDRVHQLPYTLKILLENLLRHEDGGGWRGLQLFYDGGLLRHSGRCPLALMSHHHLRERGGILRIGLVVGH